MYSWPVINSNAGTCVHRGCFSILPDWGTNAFCATQIYRKIPFAKMPKPRVGQRLKEAIGKNSANRSADLVTLTEHFNTLKERLKLLVSALKAHHGSLVQINKTRLEVAKQIVALSGGSPIHDVAGKLPPSSETGHVIANHDVNSFASVHIALSGKHQAYADKYLKFVVNYAIEWERVVVTRVTTSLKKAKDLRRNLDHYQSKVESIRQTVNVSMAKGKSVDSKTADKLKRNEDKLRQAKDEYDQFAVDLCALMEEVTERSWKDLHPMLVKMAQFDATLSGDEARTLSSLNQVVDVLKNIAQKHGLKPNARLKDIETLTAKMISTKEAETMVEGSGAHLAIKADENTEGAIVLSPTNSTPSDPWGTETGNISAPAINTVQTPEHTVSNMLEVAAAAAPAPTMDQVENATANMTISPPPQRASSFNALPPLPPSHTTGSGAGVQYGNRTRSFSGYESDSTRSMSSAGPIAPAPAAPPPPPPPAATLSMYSDLSESMKSAPAPAPAFGISTPTHRNSIGATTGNAWPTENALSPTPNGGPTPGSSSTNPFDPPTSQPVMRGGMGAGTNPFDD